MKRFLMFLVIAIAVVSLGLTIYYFSVDNEVIYIKSSYLVLNKTGSIQVRDEKNDLVDFRNKSDYTTLNYTIQQDEDVPENERVLSYNEQAGYILAQQGGEAKIIINSNNRSYARLVVDVLVCDGSEDYPFMVRNEQELLNMNANHSYKLGSDIELTGNWNPINIGAGKVFDGNYYTIKNMTITDNEVPSDGNVGFASTLNGTIKNLFLDNININVNTTSSSPAINIGAFAGTSNGVIQTSEANGIIKNTSPANHTTTGGIAGKTSSGARIDRCGFDGTLEITGSKITAGGIVGENGARITESYSRGKVDNGTYTDTYFGGIVGTNESNTGNIYDCYFYAKENFTTPSQAAGIMYNQNSDYLVTGCYYGGKINVLNNGNVANGGKLHSESNGYIDADDFKISDNFVTIEGTVKDTGEPYIRYWNFNGVWTIPTGSEYPILDVKSSAGSIYVDIKEIKPDDEETVKNIDTLYNAVKRNDKNYAIAVSTIDASKDKDGNNFVWVPIKTFDDSTNVFTHAILSQNGCEISNLTIDASSLNSSENVGLVQKIGAGGIFSGIKFKNVTIKGPNKTFKYVGVIAGESVGALISNVTIDGVNVDVSGFVANGGSAFGTLFGYADSSTKINKVDVRNVDVRDGYYTYAGGLVGINYAIISSNATTSSSGTTVATNSYNYVTGLQLVANFAGGVVGANGGTITHTTVNNFSYNNGTTNNSNHTSKIYNAGSNVFVGGIVGTNEHTMNKTRTKGYIQDVYSNNCIIEALSGSSYKMYLGGVAGYNSNLISRVYVKAVNISDKGSHNAFAGGITGYNSGNIIDCVVDQDSKIVTAVVGAGTSVNGNNYMLNTDNCTIVGGLVGYDAQTTQNVYSVYRCASLMKEIKGCYAGGIIGLAFGKVKYAYCGESTKDNGGVIIQGYFAGGLTAVIGGGFMRNCYTFCHLYTANGTFNYKNVLSVVKMETSAVGGIAVFALNSGTLVENCYAVAKFSGNGVSYGSTADLTGFTCGTVRNCAYQTAGSVATRNGTKITKADFTGTTSFNNFKNAIGGSIGDWNLTSGRYPTIYKVNVNDSGSTLPKFD